MRIIHLAKYYSPLYGGMETHVETLSRRQSQMGAEVCIICVNSFNDRLQPSQ